MRRAKNSLGVIGQGNYNKLAFLSACNQLEILIPKTLVTSSKSELISFMRKCFNNVITKSLANPYENIYKETDEEIFYHIGYTSLVSERTIKRIPEKFSLSLFQERVEKKYEIRVFYIDGRCFAQVLFSQLSDSSRLDYRLGYDSRMRMSNFDLPKRIEEQVIKLMRKLDLNTGSLDIIVTKSNQYYFLEVNPSGQFSAVSELTNYNLEYEIAKFLMK